MYSNANSDLPGGAPDRGDQELLAMMQWSGPSIPSPPAVPNSVLAAAADEEAVGPDGQMAINDELMAMSQQYLGGGWDGDEKRQRVSEIVFKFTSHPPTTTSPPPVHMI